MIGRRILEGQLKARRQFPTHRSEVGARKLSS